MNILYLSYDGMTDPLGQSQVIPYLSGLAGKGYKFTLISFEKKDRFASHRRETEKLLKDKGIHWHPLIYTPKPPVFSTLYDLRKMAALAKKLHAATPFRIVHCRSYIAALAGLSLKKKYAVKFVFDMRGFWADERVEGGLWNLNKPWYKAIYRYFKLMEKEMLGKADHIITLTENARQIISQMKNIPGNHAPVEVIPCCADTNHFSFQHISEKNRTSLQKKLGIMPGDLVLSYLGSTGTWYLTGEMMHFFSRLSRRYNHARFLIITQDNREEIMRTAALHHIDDNKIIIIAAQRNEVPSLLSLSQLSVFFIRPVFSKRASSPTKQAEVMSMGIPVICNTGIGDTDTIIKESGAGILVSEFTDNAFDEAIKQIPGLLETPPEKIRQYALVHFSLEAGVEKYNGIYRKLLDEH